MNIFRHYIGSWVVHTHTHTHTHFIGQIMWPQTTISSNRKLGKFVIHVCIDVCMYVCMYVCIDRVYRDINALTQGINTGLASQVVGARTYGTDSPTITSEPR